MSRYAFAKRTWIPHKTLGMVEIVTRRPPIWSNQPYVDRIVRAGDTMDLMASEQYGDSTRYWLLADLNPSIACPDDLAPDTLLHVPVIRT